MQNQSLKAQIVSRISQQKSGYVWTPADFIDLGSRDAVDKTLQRLVTSSQMRRVHRGLYDKPENNRFTGKVTPPDYQSVISAVSRQHKVKVLIDGMTAANDLGLTNAVPAKVIVHTDGRLQPIKIDNLAIQFRVTTPKKIYWADHPAMKIVQALYWLHDVLPQEHDRVSQKILYILQTKDVDGKIRDDLNKGLDTLPMWMRKFIDGILKASGSCPA
jgi:hypothetical protein